LRIIIKIISDNQDDIAFIIGNGINRYNNNNKLLSWDRILLSLWEKVTSTTLSKVPDGVSFTEFYDILQLNNNQIDYQKSVIEMMIDWEPKDHHRTVVSAIRELGAPILTTNYDETLSRTDNLRLFRVTESSFTDYYPWSSYHGDREFDLPLEGFGIWYINGMINYRRSIRMGLSDYMASVGRVRPWIHKDEGDNNFEGKNQNYWPGYQTWLHIIFNKSLFIFGLGLEENETFLRWLLIERKKYFKKFSYREPKGWYIDKKGSSRNNAGKEFFLNNVGIKTIKVDSYDDIYDTIWRL